MTYTPKRRIVFHGAPKSGKTENLARVPKGSRMFFVDADRQRGSFENVWKETQGNFSGLEVVEIPDAGDGDDKSFQLIRKVFWNPPSGYDFYTADSYTKIVLNLTHSICGKGERHYNQFNNQKLSSAANDFWNQWVSRIEYLEPEAWIFTVMHEKWQEIDDGTLGDRDEKPQVIVPYCGTSAQTMIPGSCDFVWHVEKGKKLVAGRQTKASFYRTIGTPTISAASVGFEKVLNVLEEANPEQILGKMGLLKKAKKGGSEKPRRSLAELKKKKG